MSSTAPGPGATLRLLDKADKEIANLDRPVIGAVYQFQREFRRNPAARSFNLEKLTGDSKLWSARINREYRALLLDLGNNDWLLVAVKHHKDVYRNLHRYAYGINHITGGIEYVDLEVVSDSVFQRTSGQPPEGQPAERETGQSSLPPDPEGPHTETTEPPESPPHTAALFAAFSSEQLAGLGVAEPLIPIVRKLTTEEELLGLVEYAPRHTGEVLLRLHDGTPYDDVQEQVTQPVAAEGPVDTDDWQTAIRRSQAVVLTEDEDLQKIIDDGDFGRWKNFLHPTQAKLVRRRTSGPTRVSGGPGTGKTIVALHRVTHLVDQLPAGNSKPVLLTTFNKNLAADLRARLLSLGGPETLARVDIRSIDQLASHVVREAGPRNSSGKRLTDNQALQEWRAMLDETGHRRWSPEFLSDEWNQIILGQAVHTRSEYFRARRAGRGRISRAERAEIWQLTEQFTQRLHLRGLETFRQVADRAARLELARKERIEAHQADRDARNGLNNIHLEAGSAGQLRYRYRHAVVDEAQDLSSAHWKLLRAMVPAGPDDLFIVGDTHQRIYDQQVTLGSLGINIRGRSSRLTLSYRTTREILRDAHRVLADAEYDDLDGGTDDLAGHRSVLHGNRPVLHGEQTWDRELDAIVDQISAWHTDPDNSRPLGSMAVCVPTNAMVTEAATRLSKAGLEPAEITEGGPKGGDGVHVGTMYRFKGLEYQCIVIAGVREGLVPRDAVDRWRDTDPARHTRELCRARSVLFVAATRARDALAIFWHGEPSRFLKPLQK